MTASTMVIFMMASASLVVLVTGSECPSEDEPNSVVSLLQTHVQLQGQSPQMPKLLAKAGQANAGAAKAIKGVHVAALKVDEPAFVKVSDAVDVSDLGSHAQEVMRNPGGVILSSSNSSRSFAKQVSTDKMMIGSATKSSKGSFSHTVLSFQMKYALSASLAACLVMCSLVTLSFPTARFRIQWAVHITLFAISLHSKLPGTLECCIYGTISALWSSICWIMDIGLGDALNDGRLTLFEDISILSPCGSFDDYPNNIQARMPTSTKTLQKVWRAIDDCVAADILPMCTFIDFGSGLGSVLGAAMEREFAAVVGVEIEEVTARACQLNVDLFAQIFVPPSKQAEVVCMNMCKFDFSNHCREGCPVVLFMYEPLWKMPQTDAMHIYRLVLQNLLQCTVADDKDAYVVYLSEKLCATALTILRSESFKEVHCSISAFEHVLTGGLGDLYIFKTVSSS